jgi:hypothetical protein
MEGSYLQVVTTGTASYPLPRDRRILDAMCFEEPNELLSKINTVCNWLYCKRLGQFRLST